MRKTLSAIVGILLLATIPLTYFAFNHHAPQQKNKTQAPYDKGPYTSQINTALDLYIPSKMQELGFDGYWLLYKVNQITGNVSSEDLLSLKEKYKDNPYKILVDKHDPLKNISFKRDIDKVGTKEFYTLPPMPDSITNWDPTLLKALYCKKADYDDADFQTLSALKNRGGYYDNHYILGLLFLRENHCYSQDIVSHEIATTAAVLIQSESEDKEFSDLFAERIVMLYWAGYGSQVKKEWIDTIANSFDDVYGWNDKGNIHFAGHPTGLSLLALIYYSEGKDKQPLLNN